MYRELSRSGLALVLLIGLLLRLGFVATIWDDVQTSGRLNDPDDYGRLAVNLVRTFTFGYPIEKDNASPVSAAAQVPDTERVKQSKGQTSKPAPAVRSTAYRPPLYPSLLTAAAIPDLVKKVPLDQVKLNPFVVLGLHILMGVATIGLVYYVAWRLDFRWPWLPALAVAADPILLFWSGEMMTETTITLLAVWAWSLYLKLVRPEIGEVGRRVMGMRMSLRVSLILGMVLGLAILTRPTILPWAILMIASLSLRGSDAGNRVSMITAALIVMSVINAAWMIRNNQQFGKPICTTTHGGYTLLLANNPSIYKHFKSKGPDRAWDAEDFHKHWALRRTGNPIDLAFWDIALPQGPVKAPNIDELKDDRLAQAVAIATIKSDPQTFALSCLYRAGWLWSPYPAELGQADNSRPDPRQAAALETSNPNQSEQAKPTADDATDKSKSVGGSSQGFFLSLIYSPDTKRVLIGIWYSCWFLMAATGLFWLREALTSRVWLMPILLVLTLTAIHMVYWSNMRMRAPMMPVVYMIACWPLMRTRTPSRL